MADVTTLIGPPNPRDPWGRPLWVGQMGGGAPAQASVRVLSWLPAFVCRLGRQHLSPITTTSTGEFTSSGLPADTETRWCGCEPWTNEPDEQEA